MTAKLRCRPTLCSRLRTDRAALGLSVEAVLLYSRTRGLRINVWVTLICRPRLLDNRVGQVPRPLRRLISLSNLWIPPLCRLPGILVIPSGNLMPR